MNLLLRSLRVCVDVDPALIDDPTYARKLARGHRFVACSGGLVYKGTRHRSLESALQALGTEAERLATQALASGGEDTATGRYLLDRTRLALLAAQHLVRRAARFWPELAEVSL